MDPPLVNQTDMREVEHVVWVYVYSHSCLCISTSTTLCTLSAHSPPWSHLLCISAFLSGPACVEPRARVRALVCHRWNGCGWQASGRQRETGAEEAWLTDGSADTLRAWVVERGLLFHNSPSLVTAWPPSACSPYFSLTPLLPPVAVEGILCPLERCEVCLQWTLVITSSLTCCPPSLFILLALVLFISLLFFSLSHSVLFLLPCVRCDMNAAAAPSSPRSWPLLCIAFSPLALPPPLNGFLTTLWGWVGAGVSLAPLSLAFPAAGMCPCSSKLHKAKMVALHLESKLEGRGQWFGKGWWLWLRCCSSHPLLLYSFCSLSSEWQQIGKDHTGITAKLLFCSPASLLWPWLCQSHQLASNFIYKKPKLLRLKPLAMRQFRFTVV